MKISIITVCRNSEGTIRDTIESVLCQSYKNFEYLIIDGESQDDTINIIKEYRNDIDFLISEKDDSLWDAMNKGLANATGDVIGFLNSDDFYAHHYVLEDIYCNFIQNNVDALYGYVDIVDQCNIYKIVRKYRVSSFNRKSFSFGLMPAHPTFYCKKNIYDNYGYYDLNNDITPDFEIMVRFLTKANIQTLLVPKVLVKMRNGGLGNSSLLYRIQRYTRQVNSCRINGLWSHKLLMLFKIPYKIFEYI